MPHLYTNTAPAKPNRTVKPLDPLLPLADLAASSAFSHRHQGRDTDGKVIAQRISKDDPAHHPHLFYVEFPAGSASYHEVSMNKLSAILADGRTGHFSHLSVARILGNIPAAYKLPSLLKAAAP
jgi:hypothetical protein